MEAAVAKPMCASPQLIADWVDKMCCQLVEIHAIAAAQQVERTRWHRSDPGASPVRAEAGR
jgi:hypothetical protein